MNRGMLERPSRNVCVCSFRREQRRVPAPDGFWWAGGQMGTGKVNNWEDYFFHEKIWPVWHVCIGALFQG